MGSSDMSSTKPKSFVRAVHGLNCLIYSTVERAQTYQLYDFFHCQLLKQAHKKPTIMMDQIRENWTQITQEDEKGNCVKRPVRTECLSIEKLGKSFMSLFLQSSLDNRRSKGE